MTLTEFLFARIAEDEASAQAVIDCVGSTRTGDLYSDGSGIADRPDFPSYPWGNNDAEIAYMERFDPRRVLAECEAKRRMVNETWGGPDHEDMWLHHMSLLAAVYADHPDYQQEWQP